MPVNFLQSLMQELFLTPGRELPFKVRSWQLPATGGTVTVADGVWKIDSLLQLNGVNNFNLVGQSLNAQLMFTGAGQMWFGRVSGVSNATISTLTINANALTLASDAAMRVSNAQNVSFNNNHILGHQFGSIPALFFEGG